jgi:hypothetical protein
LAGREQAGQHLIWMMTLQEFLGRASGLRWAGGGQNIQRQRRSRNGGFVIGLIVYYIGTLASRHPRDASFSNGIKADAMLPVELPPTAD